MKPRQRVSVLFLMCFLLICISGSYGCNKITATAQPGGTISPSGSITVWKGSSRGFTMVPSAGNVIADVRVDGTSAPLGTSPTYTFSNIQADHTIIVSFITDTGHYRIFNVLYGTAGTKLDKCVTCHNPHASPTASTPLANAYGRDVASKRNIGYTKYQSLRLVEPLNSDGDVSDNVTEINARTYPGDPLDHP